MNDAVGVILIVAGVIYGVESVKKMQKVAVDGDVEKQRLMSEASKEAALNKVLLPQCPETVTNVNITGMKV